MTTSYFIKAMILDIEKRVALDPQDFEGMVDTLKKLLTNTFDKAARESVLEAINLAQGFQGTLDSLKAAVEAKFQADLGVGFAEAVRRQAIDITQAAYKLGMDEAVNKGVSFALGGADLGSLAAINTGTMFWIGEHYGDHIQKPLEAELSKFFGGGYSRADLAQALESTFQGVAQRSAAYWDFFADHVATKTREIGRLSGYEQMGVEVVRVKAHLDDKTTEFCRRINGQIIAVKDLRRNVDRYLEACQSKDKEGIKNAWPWWSDSQAMTLTSAADIQDAVKAGEIGLPPYHPRCRTVTVVEFEARAGDHINSPGEGSPIPDKQAPQGPPPPAWTRVGEQLGSNPGGQYQDAAGGLWYAKFYENPAQARAEALGFELSRRAGIAAPEYKLDSLEVEGKPTLGIFTRWREGQEPIAEFMGPGAKRLYAADKEQLTKNYILAALAGNRDLVGAEFENLVRVDGKWMCMDQGGSFAFRAKGGVKDFGVVPLEFESMLSPGRSVERALGPTVRAELAKDGKWYSRWLKRLKPGAIREAILAAGADPAYAMTIEARQKVLVEKLAASQAGKALPGERLLRGHLPISPSPATIIEHDFLAANVETKGEALARLSREANGAIYGFTSTQYRAIRSAQLGRAYAGFDMAEALRKADLIEDYLDVAPAFDFEEGKVSLWRGMPNKGPFFADKNPGDQFNLMALASSSSDFRRAASFTNQGEESVVLHIVGDVSPLGTSVTFASRYGLDESEVLLSGRNTLEIIAKRKVKGYNVVECKVFGIAERVRKIIKALEDAMQATEQDMTDEQVRASHMESDAETPELFIVNGKQVLTSWQNGVVGGKVVSEQLEPSHPLYVRDLGD